MTHTLSGASTPRRRIAVIEIPQTQRTRLGTIRQGQPFVSLVPVGNEPPSNASTWLASVLASQSTTRETTPGTLIYTPAPAAAPSPVAPWNSWAGPCAIAQPSGSGATSSSTSTSTTNHSSLWLIAAALGAAASVAYLIDSGDRAARNRK